MKSDRSAIQEGLENVRGAIVELHDFLSWAHSETIWQMEKQTELLRGISDTLKSPRVTQADELYKMGVESFRRRRLADAFASLEEARRLNPNDYRVLITLGHAYVLSKELPKALESFQAAVDYARVDKYRGMALLLVARTYRCLGRAAEAVKAATMAAGLLKQYAPAHYELAECIGEHLKGSDTTG